MSGWFTFDQYGNLVRQVYPDGRIMRNGNTVNVNDPVAGLTSMGWDKENRLVLHQQGGSIATYGYSGDNLKRTELVDGSLTTLVWDGSDHLGQIP